MYQGQLSNSAYRIKKKKTNTNANDQRLISEDDPFKISIHSSTQMSPGKKQRGISQGFRYRENKLERFSTRSKRSSKNMASSSITTFTKKNTKPQKIIQFDNVKWLSIISAYDPKQLKNVTTSAQSYQKFLKNGDIRKDPYNKQTFKVMIDHFRCWVARIRGGYFQILNKFLSQNTNTSAIVTLANVKPLLEQVKFQSSMMHEKVKTCQQTQNYRQFSGLLLKFDSFLEASHEIEEIIYIVNQSKNRIDDLFKNLEQDQEIGKKVNKERRRGIKKARHAVKDYGDDAIQGKILERVQSAINEMANKTLEAFSKINGARGLMIRIQQCLQDRGDPHNLQNIITINQIFREVIRQADQFQKFSQHFMQEGDILNDDLKQCILRYKEQVTIKKQAVFQMQLKFISNIIEVSIQSLQANYSVCNTIQSNLCEEYQKIQDLLISICQIISDETQRVHVDLMIKDNKEKFKKISYLMNKMKNYARSSQGRGSVFIDTENGMTNLLSLEETIKAYKSLIRNIVERQQRTYRQITNKRPPLKQEFPEQDAEQQYIKDLIKLSKTMNQQEKKKEISHLSAIQQLKKTNMKSIHENDLNTNRIKIIKWCYQVWQKHQELQNSNELSNLVHQLQINDEIYENSSYLLDVFKISSNTKQTNIIGQIQSLKKFAETAETAIRANFLERCLYQILYLGLEPRMVDTIECPSKIKFPDTQHDIESITRDIKYLNLLKNTMPKTNKFTSESFQCTIELETVSGALQQIIQGVKISESIKWNKDQKYYLNHQLLFETNSKLFNAIFISKSSNIGQIIDIIVENLGRCCENLNKLRDQEVQSKNHSARIHQITTIIDNYTGINQQLRKQLMDIVQICIDHLEVYAKVIAYFCRYLHETKQSCHIILNNAHDKYPIWVSQANDKSNNALGQALGLNGLKKGEAVPKYEDKPCIAHNRRPPSAINKQALAGKNDKKTPKQNKNDIDDEMDEYIQDADQMEDQMAEEMGDQMVQQMGDQMAQQMGDQMGDQMQDQMGDQMGDEVNDGPMDEINDVEFDDDFIDQIKDSNRPKSIKKQSKIKSPQNSKALEQKYQKKSPEKPKQQEFSSAKIIPKTHKITYQIFPSHIKTLEDLADLVSKFHNLYSLFWNYTTFNKIEQYFNREYKGEISKELMTQLEQFCKQNFSKDILGSKSLPDLDGYKQIVKSIHQIDYYKFEELSKVLGVSNKGRKYSQLLGTNNELLRVSIENDDAWRASKAVDGYLQNILKQINIEKDNFNTASYKKQLIKQRKSNIFTLYKIPTASLQPEPQSIKSEIKKIIECSQKYLDFSKFPDTLDIETVIITLWWNCCEKEARKQSLEVPAQLYTDIDKIKEGLNSDNFISYVKSVYEDCDIKLNKMIQHEKMLKQIFNDSSNQDNLLTNIKTLIKCYQCQQKAISFNKDYILIKLTNLDNQIRQILHKLLIPPSKNTISEEQIQANIKNNPEIYGQRYKFVGKMLSILGIESHIWVSEFALEIFDTKENVVNCLLSEVSCGKIKSCENLQPEALQAINSAIKIKQLYSMVWEYFIEEDSCLSKKNNENYLEKLDNLRKTHQKLLKLPENIGLCVPDNVLSLNLEQQSKTQQIFQQIFQIEQQLNSNQLLTTQPKSLFVYDQNNKQEIKRLSQILTDKQKSLNSIVDPIDFSGKEEDYLEDFKKRNQAIKEIYEIYEKVDSKELSLLKVCLCKKVQNEEEAENAVEWVPCDQNKHLWLYVNQKGKGSLMEDILGCVFAEPTQIYHNLFEKFIQTSSTSQGNFRQTQIFHANQFLHHLSSSLDDNIVEAMQSFMNQYNYKHFIDSTHSLAMQEYKKISKILTNKHATLKYTEQFLSKTNQDGLLHQKILKSFNFDNREEIKQKVDVTSTELEYLNNIDMSSVVKYGQYSSFGKWVLQIVGKVYKIQTIILMDALQPNVMVCIMPQMTGKTIQQQLSYLKLPTEYRRMERKKSFMKIKLGTQQIHYTLDQKIEEEELIEFKEANFLLSQETSSMDQGMRRTIYFGAYRYYNNEQNDKQEALLYTAELSEEILHPQGLKIGISGEQISAELQFRIIEAEVPIKELQVTQNISDNFKSILVSEKYRAFLGETIKLQKTIKWLRKQIDKYKQKKKEEEEAIFILEQKRLEEQRKKQQEEERRIKEQQEERKRKEQEEQLKRKQAEQEQRRKKEEEKKGEDKKVEGDDEFDLDDQNNKKPDQNSDKYVPH